LITKIAINSQTFRVVLNDGKVIDYHIVGGLTSSILLKFLDGLDFDVYYTNNIKSKFQELNVEEKNEFSWKSKIDGSDKINYVDKTNVHIEQKNTEYSRRPTFFYLSPKPIIPPKPSYGDHNKKEFKKLFGGA